MCHICITEGAKAHMLSRRDFFKKSALVGAAGLGLSAAAPTLAESAGKVADLTHLFNDKFPTFHGTTPIVLEANKTAGYQSFRITLNEHSGTHIDAPLHFIPDGTSVDELPVENLVCPLAVLDVKAKAREDANYMVTPEDIEAYMTQYGAIKSGSCVAMNSGWASKVNDPSYRNDADGNLAFPGFSKAACDLLIELGVVAIAVDTLSLDPGNSTDFPVHYNWLPSGRYGIENIAGLDDVPAVGATIFTGVLKIEGGTGGPTRVIAVY